MKNSKVIHMVTVAKSLELMKGQLEYLQEKGYNVGILSSPGSELERLEFKNKIPVPMEREINIFQDIKSLIKLVSILYKEKPEILNTGTPKAGLLGIVASFITRVPNRIYTLRGLKLETAHGLKRKVLWLTEKIACLLATNVICISPSLRDEAVKLKLVKKEKVIILGSGSSNGVALKNYPAAETILEEVTELKSQLKINNKEFVMGFVGRIVRDKGINELIETFKNIRQKYKNVKLLMLGSFENGDPVNYNTRYEIENNINIIHVGHVEDPSIYYYLMDVLVFPTYREGFGNVSIQAQAAETPVITTNATGAVDTVINKETGYIVPIKNITEIVNKTTYLIENEDVKLRMGAKGRERVIDNFDSKVIWEEMNCLYKAIT